MVVIRKALQKDMSQIKSMLKKAKFNISDFSINGIMVVEEDTQLVGIGCIKIFEEIAFIRGILVKDNNLELSDGLVRAMINYADRRNVKKIYTPVSKQKSIYQKIGFLAETAQQGKKLFTKIGDKYKELLVLDVDDFFGNHQCKSV